MTAATRKAAERQRRKDAGLARLEIWAPPALHDAIREAAAQLLSDQINPGVRHSAAVMNPAPQRLTVAWRR